ncbi:MULTISPECIES: hypothetical protein [Robertmurraya]|uniref:Uncharacterized protein n=1 Tax=Robertmurraya beringensis TaxID=641660 RepID=A0ABV6KVI0_9BACI
MKKSTFSKIAWSYITLVSVALVIYLFKVQENGYINPVGQKDNILWFIILLAVGLVLLGVMMAATKTDKEGRIDSKTILGGLVIACFFLVWRVGMVIF